MSTERYVSASCHVEDMFSDRTWRALLRVLETRPGGISVAALIRLPHPSHGEDRGEWLARAREAAALGPFGLHIHWMSPRAVVPCGIDPAEPLLREGRWLEAEGVRPTLFCGGRWYTERTVAEACASLGYADCTPRPRRPRYFAEGEPWAQLDAPATVELPSGATLVALPSTHSPGEFVRMALRGGLSPWVHLAFHDTDLVEPLRRWEVIAALRLLGRLGKPVDLDVLAAHPPAARVRWDEIERGEAVAPAPAHAVGA